MVMRYQTDPADIIVGIGPHIERENYEIQDDVVELFMVDLLTMKK